MPISLSQANQLLLLKRRNSRRELPWLCFTSLEDGSSVGMELHFVPDSITIDIKYSYDGNSWTQWDFSDITLDRYEKVYMKGTNNSMAGRVNSSSPLYWCSFTMSGRIAASGSIMTLLYENDPYTNVFKFNNSLYHYYFHSLFNGCVALEEPPELPAVSSNTTRSDWRLGPYCYYEMFYGCTNLKRAPALPFKYTSSYCCQRMFYNCTSITTAPEIISENLRTFCFDSMFAGCTSLVSGPSVIHGGETDENGEEISALSRMFQNCVSLQNAPEIKAQYIKEHAFNQMFAGCTSLRKAPKMPTVFYNKQTNAAQQFYAMFDGCVSLEDAPAEIEVNGEAVANIFRYFCRNCIKLRKAPNIVMKAPLQDNSSNDYADAFFNCVALEEPPEEIVVGQTSYTCSNMFYGCTSLKKAPKIRVLNYHSSGRQFANMFAYCTSLEAPPDDFIGNGIELPPYACSMMFYYCVSMKRALNLPVSAMGAFACQSMYAYCTSLEEPPVISALTVGNYACTSMFSYCVSLKRIPALPATTLGQYCYIGMFQGAGDAYSAESGHVELPAATLVANCYTNMFAACKCVTSVKMDFTSTPGYTTASIQSMFNGCQSIKSIEVAFTDWGSSATWRQNWVMSANANCTLIKPAALPTTTAGNSTYLATWTLVDKAV